LKAVVFKLGWCSYVFSGAAYQINFNRSAFCKFGFKFSDKHNTQFLLLSVLYKEEGRKRNPRSISVLSQKFAYINVFFSVKLYLKISKILED